jgi:ubiquinone/menaquinone biosynthesis C-methylase UbiE
VRPYDPALYLGAAEHYARGRPRYSRELVPTLAAHVRIDGHGQLLDVGCGPGSVAVELAPHFDTVVGVDPDAAMLEQARARAAVASVDNVRWEQRLAEDLRALDLGPCRLVTFGQSFHWTDTNAVAAIVYELLEPGGAIVLLAHQFQGRPQPPGPEGVPEIPRRAVQTLIEAYLGPRKRAGTTFAGPPKHRYEELLAATCFGPPEVVYAPGRADIVQDVDGVIDNCLSTSFAAPHLFGNRLADFEADLRAELLRRSPAGQFWDWPGDTCLVIGRKPA